MDNCLDRELGSIYRPRWNIGGDAKKILEGGSSLDNLKVGKGCVSATKIHNGVPVGSIEFNPHKKNLLASGGSEVLI